MPPSPLNDVTPPGARAPGRSVAVRLLAGYAFLGVWGALSVLLTRMNALWLGLAVTVLATPAMLWLWHRYTVRRLAALHQFQPGGWLHRFGRRTGLGIVLRALVALALGAAALLQSLFFTVVEWSTLGLAPLIFLAVRAGLARVTRLQFSAEVYAGRWVSTLAGLMVTGGLLLLWLSVRYSLGEAPDQAVGERVYQSQQGWKDTPSGLLRWIADAFAWGNASLEGLGRYPDDPLWRLLLAGLLAPVSVLAFAVWSLAGLSLGRQDLRRIFGGHLMADEVAPVGAGRVFLWSAVATVGAMILISLLAEAEGLVTAKQSPFAVKRLPECERIGGVAYQVGTIEALRANLAGAIGALGAAQAATCAKIGEIEAQAARGVDAYLDWYFSLGAEWARLATLLTGDIDRFLEAKFKEMVIVNAGVEPLLAQVRADHERQLDAVFQGHRQVRELMEKNRLVIADGQCRVVAETRINPALAALETHQARFAGGAAAGLAGGAFAATVAAKAMGKTGMKAAGKVLGKVAAKKAAGVVGSAAVGAAVGSVVPGLGTAVGGAVGGVVGGLAVGAAVDMAALALEEKLTRADLKRDLMAAVTESLQPARDLFECR
ncbi:MAG TPA: hypothetical protein VN230_05780 [Burkholderiaceae bacterium]|nr:hypothetical protein [Burkholderiaceae bacterium]